MTEQVTIAPNPTVRWVHGDCECCGKKRMIRGQKLAPWNHTHVERTGWPNLTFRGYCGECKPGDEAPIKRQEKHPRTLVELSDPAELRLLRKRGGWQQNTLAQAAGLAKSTVCRIEHGRATGLSTLRRYLAALGVYEEDVHYKVVR